MPQSSALRLLLQGTAGINAFIALAGLWRCIQRRNQAHSRGIELAAYTPVALIALWLGCGACGALSTCELSPAASFELAASQKPPTPRGFV